MMKLKAGQLMGGRWRGTKKDGGGWCCFGRCRKFHISKKMLKIYAAAFAVMFSTAFSITLVFPFLPFMVQFLLPEIEETDTGKYAGLMASSLFFGRFLSNYIWGSIADSKGRKPVLVISSVLTGLATAAFGFSASFTMAVITRFFIGFFNGIVGTIKASLSESSDNNNQAIGMAVITSAFGTGLVIGPSLSGAIADPIGQYNLTISNQAINSFLTLFPYSPPCIISGVLFILTAIFVTIWMPETHGQGKKKKQSAAVDRTADNAESLAAERDSQGEAAIAVNDHLKADLATVKEEEEEEEGDRQSVNESQKLTGEQDRGESLTEDDDTEVDSTHRQPKASSSSRRPSYILTTVPDRRNSFSIQYVKAAWSQLTHRGEHRLNTDQEEVHDVGTELEQIGESDEDALLGTEDHTHSRASRFRSWLMKMLRQLCSGFIKSLKDLKLFMSDRTTRLALFCYCTFSFAIISFDEVYSLWCATSRYYGGLGFALHDIGISLSVVGFLNLPFSFFIFPLFERLMGSINTFQFCTLFQIFIVILLPSLHYFENTVLLWFFLIAMLLLLRLSGTVCFGALFLFINNSVTFDKLGAVNGLGTTLTALFRTVAPVFAGSIYSVSLTDGLSFPLNYYLIFIIFGIIMLIVMVMVACLPKTINKQKVVASSHQESSGVGNDGETGELTREHEGLLGIDQEQQDVSNNRTDV